jgi:tRNA threonylcarbamoyladenosine biosynthesis protein TsaE
MINNQEFESGSEAETARFAAALAPQLRQGDIILLHGDLGAGKTTFARALIRALTGEAALEVPSPTFTLVQTYDTPLGDLWHFDLYRLKNSDEIYEVGWEEALGGGLILLEWPERLGALLPPVRLDIRLSPVPGKNGARLIQVKNAAI